MELGKVTIRIVSHGALDRRPDSTEVPASPKHKGKRSVTLCPYKYRACDYIHTKKQAHDLLITGLQLVK